jgi:hypothetical protein
MEAVKDGPLCAQFHLPWLPLVHPRQDHLNPRGEEDKVPRPPRPVALRHNGLPTGAEIALGTLVHCALAVPDGRPHLMALTQMVSTFDGAWHRFSKWKPGPAIISDIAFWHNELSKPFCGSMLHDLPPPSQIEFWVDASTSYGVGVVFNRKWDVWMLRNGWKADGRKIGWAEMVAIKLGLWVAIELGFHDMHFVVHLDNMGVIGSLGAGKARNSEQNQVLQRIVALMRVHGLWITSEYVASATNIADTLLRGIPPAARVRLGRHIPLPPCLDLYLLHN